MKMLENYIEKYHDALDELLLNPSDDLNYVIEVEATKEVIVILSQINRKNLKGVVIA